MQGPVPTAHPLVPTREIVNLNNRSARVSLRLTRERTNNQASVHAHTQTNANIFYTHTLLRFPTFKAVLAAYCAAHAPLVLLLTTLLTLSTRGGGKGEGGEGAGN